MYKSLGSSMIVDFSWQLLHNRLLIGKNLFKRQIALVDIVMRCALCTSHVELMRHFFVTCEVASSLWYKLFSWVCMSTPLPCSILEVFEIFQGLGPGKKNLLVWFRSGI